jgi:hypothetical protein
MMKHRRLLISAALMLSLLAGFVVAQPASEESKARADQSQALPFEPAETLIYEGEFTRALLRGIDVADLHFSFSRAPSPTDKSEAQAQPVMHITAEAVSKGIVSKLFGLNFRQKVESIVEPTTFSVLQTTKLDEQGKRKRTSEAVFDKNSGKVVFTELDPNDPSRPPRVVTSQISGAVQDIASAFYYLRTQKLEPGKTLELLISDTGQTYHIPVKVIKREQLKTVLGKVSTLRVVPELFGDGRLIRGKGEITIWFTDDARHIPVRAKINNSLGRLDIKLKSMTNSKDEG